MIYWILGIVWLALIYYFGTSPFGRAQTQRWIDRCKNRPRLWCALDRYHGTLRAAFHYVEFGGLYLVAYLTLTRGSFRWRDDLAFILLAATFVSAYFDELHQARTAGRCFRRIDLLHSLLGATLALLLTYLIG
jgi:VanZ family protein